MATYLRFQTGACDADACYGLGVFSVVGTLEDNGMIEQHLVRVVHGDKLLEEKLGRNDLCPCGSGKHFKVCCLKSGRF